MAYSTVADLRNYIPESQLIQLTDDNDTGTIDQLKINDALRRAQDYIDSHLMGRYDLPLSTVPESIRDMSNKLACYFLFKRTLALTLPDQVKDDYDDVTALLRKIQIGKFNPFPITKNPIFFKSNKIGVFATSNNSTGGVLNTLTNGWTRYP
jgi:phage gp36-like protein